MTTIERTFTVGAAPEAVLDYLKDFSRAEEWDPGTERCVRTDDGPVGVGSTWQNESKIAGLSTELTYRLAELTDDRLVFVGGNDSASTKDTITVRRSGAGSEITYRADIEIEGIAGKLAAPATKLVFEKIGRDTEHRLTEVLNRLAA